MPIREKPASHDNEEDDDAYKDWSESDEDDIANHKVILNPILQNAYGTGHSCMIENCFVDFGLVL